MISKKPSKKVKKTIVAGSAAKWQNDAGCLLSSTRQEDGDVPEGPPGNFSSASWTLQW